MAEPVLWVRESHTAAKHRVLRSYLDAWIPVMAHQALRVRGHASGTPRLLLVDGFAGPGRYAGGEPGSPLIMLEALLSHKAFDQFANVTFSFLFIEQDLRRVEHLRGEIHALGDLPANVSVRIEHGEFESLFGSLVDGITDRGNVLVPTFTFIDPFGYSSASMSLTGRLTGFPRCEVLYFVPLSFVHRFVGRDGQEAALTSLFGSEQWRGAIDLSGDERRAYLLELFERQLSAGAHVEYVRSFQLHTEDGNDYRLVFGLGHRKGLEIAKDAMWAVDPVGGTSFAATTESGQEVLFAPAELLGTGPLLAELRAKFGRDWFTIEQAEQCTLIDTPFRIGQLRRDTLAPAVREEVLEIQRPGRSGFKGARLRFS
ncbi:MAG TPA: three-Cys-motif partner protein TcmP [Solirubrobacteraceae bacterium]|jgi:three-Cys-motif partner protein|nr:three-Cys-motif partner protein TcmP [Solirubrobacteraceae bacterium]